MTQPLGSGQPYMVCKLQKSLYGLKQVPRAWFDRLQDVLHQLGFLGFEVDNSLFFKHDRGETLLVLVYVDNLIIMGSEPSHIDALV